mmetsp:Transcript_12782/g.40786  ORF Transcript_12782/g.40786 Transcript_12782/m.40786 type:complete len:243 (-) Transcript_12782:1226-1954(-)
MGARIRLGLMVRVGRDARVVAVLHAARAHDDNLVAFLGLLEQFVEVAPPVRMRGEGGDGQAILGVDVDVDAFERLGRRPHRFLARRQQRRLRRAVDRGLRRACGIGIGSTYVHDEHTEHAEHAVVEAHLRVRVVLKRVGADPEARAARSRGRRDDGVIALAEVQDERVDRQRLRVKAVGRDDRQVVAVDGEAQRKVLARVAHAQPDGLAGDGMHRRVDAAVGAAHAVHVACLPREEGDIVKA